MPKCDFHKVANSRLSFKKLIGKISVFVKLCNSEILYFRKFLMISSCKICFFFIFPKFKPLCTKTLGLKN